MTQVEPDASVIELGVPGPEHRTRGGPAVAPHLRRRALIAVLALSCLLTLAASVRGHPRIGDPLWIGSVSLNGFTLGTRSLYVARVDGKAVTALDLLTGRPRWTHDITELPDSVNDLGNGVAVVMTRPPSGDGASWPDGTITLVRDATGERIAQTAGNDYLPSVDGRLLLVFSKRSGDPDGCAAPETNCVDVTAWDIRAGTVAWKVNLAPSTNFVPSIVDGRIEAMAEFDTDGMVRIRHMSTGAVEGTVSLSPEFLGPPLAQVGLVRDMFLTARRGPEGITLTAYRRPSLVQGWSVVVADFTAMNDRGEGGLYLWQCGPDACLTVNGADTWVINTSTGSVAPPITFQVIQRLGGAGFLVTPLHGGSPSDAMAGHPNGLIIDPDGRILAELAVAGVVDWSDSGDRSLVTQEGPDRTGFRVIDGRGNVSSLGSVPGTRLTCHARADILACSDPGGALRVWRLPR
jgi:hypothetical protein